MAGGALILDSETCVPNSLKGRNCGETVLPFVCVCREGPSSTTHQTSFSCFLYLEILFLVTRSLASRNLVNQPPSELELERAGRQTGGW